MSLQNSTGFYGEYGGRFVPENLVKVLEEVKQAFYKGGRGFCSYLCPIGAAQCLIHSIGSRLKFTYKLIYKAERCSSCASCTLKCPMGALRIAKEGLIHQVHNCITCNQCVNACSRDALSYGPIDRGNVNIKKQYKMNDKGNENEIR